MRRITTENQEDLRKWLSKVGNVEYPDTTMCIGQEKDGELIAVVGYNNFTPNACQIHVAITNIYWLNKALGFSAALRSSSSFMASTPGSRRAARW